MDLARLRREAHLRRQQAPTAPRSREDVPVVTLSPEESRKLADLEHMLGITDHNYRLPGESVVEWRRRTRSFSARVTRGGGDTAL